MSATIFCNFDQQDLADLAVGKLSSSVPGIKSINIIEGFKPKDSALLGARNTSMMGGFLEISEELVPVPDRTTMVKIVCQNAARDAVVSKLVNLRAHQIITTK